MEQKIVKITEDQLRQVVNEVFSYLGNGTTDTNQKSETMVNLPYDNPDIDAVPTKADQVSHTLSNCAWWRRHYGFNGYAI